MLDFMEVNVIDRKGKLYAVPEFKVFKTKDLMIKGGKFFAIWDEETGLWTKDYFRAIEIVDTEIQKVADKSGATAELCIKTTAYKTMDKLNKYIEKDMYDTFETLDSKVIFANDVTTKEDYATFKLNYSLEHGLITNWDRLVSTLYSPKERHKIEWSIGAIVSGDSKYIQKFLVFYGSGGTGKSTILNIVGRMFEGYVTNFVAKDLGNGNKDFALAPFRSNPLIAIEHDGDLSKINDNTRLNSIVSHERITINEKFKTPYSMPLHSFLMIGSNSPVKITDSKSGLLRRLIDIIPTGNTLPSGEYKYVLDQIYKWELGSIAKHCLDVYNENPDYYNKYVPGNMMEETNLFYDFMQELELFIKDDQISLKQAWTCYKNYCDDSGIQDSYRLIKKNFKNELKTYFKEMVSSAYIDGEERSNVFRGLKKLGQKNEVVNSDIYTIEFKEIESTFDKECADCMAQLTNEQGMPKYKWDNVKTKLSDISTKELHYVKVPENHIVIDFDIPDEEGNKSYDKNLEAASKFPPTYAELSKSGAGIHLHYIYEGDISKLSRIYADHIEIKIFNGNSSLRRKLTKCNDLPINKISSGLPLKGEKKMINQEVVMNEKFLRNFINKCLRKEHHGNTSSEINFIHDKLKEAYESGMVYDVSDLRRHVFTFAANSTNQSERCMDMVAQMKFKSEETADNVEFDDDKKITFYDVEVFPNLFLICYKNEGEGDESIRPLPNPTSDQVIDFISKRKLVGFNCRNYDNHILYAASMGYSNEQLYRLSQRIINGEKDAKFREAYNISYTDIYDYSAKKQSLKKWEIELGIHHRELAFPWDEPVDVAKWKIVIDYCKNDVSATEAVWKHTKGDFTARKILAALAGGTVNDTTNTLTTKIIFDKERNPELIYTDLATGEREDGTHDKAFPGYEYKYLESAKKYTNVYRDVDVGKGGYVYAEPGMYRNVALLDVQSMHPNSAVNLNYFGKYTQRFKDILDARVLIKHKQFDEARHMLDGKLAEYLDDESVAADLSQALKTAINSVYGLTSASFDNPFTHRRNVNNIVALRGALFMKTLQDEVQKRGYVVAHVKTDSIKIPDATPEIIQFVTDFGKEYGYIFEHEATYDRMCLVNNAVYIAKYSDDENINGKHAGEWTATGAEFQHPYIFKKLFSHEDVTFDDLCETKSVKTSLYLDFNEHLDDVTMLEKELEKTLKKLKQDPDYCDESRIKELEDEIKNGHRYQFVGKIGLFAPVKPGCGGGLLMREKDGKYYSVGGTKGYRWRDAEVIKAMNEQDTVDTSYHDTLVSDAIDSINKYGDFDIFVSTEPLPESYNTHPF